MANRWKTMLFWFLSLSLTIYVVMILYFFCLVLTKMWSKQAWKSLIRITWIPSMTLTICKKWLFVNNHARNFSLRPIKEKMTVREWFLNSVNSTLLFFSPNNFMGGFRIQAFYYLIAALITFSGHIIFFMFLIIPITLKFALPLIIT